MEKFLNPIDPAVFRVTNAPWNDLKLNNPWSVGYVSALVSVHPFKNKESWEQYYYQSGEQRLREIGNLEANVQNELNDFQLVLTDPNKVKFYHHSLKRYNLYRGRTKAELELKGQVLLAETKQRAPSVNIDLDTATDCVRFRTICETWSVLGRDLHALLLIGEATKSIMTAYGQKYEICGAIKGPSGRSADVVTVWIIRHGESIPRFVTAYPGGKK